MAAPKSKKGKGKVKYVQSTPAQQGTQTTQPVALPELPAAAVNTPSPDPEPGDDASNKPGSASLEVAVNAPGGVPGVTVPKWALWAGGTVVGLSAVAGIWAVVRSSR
jgi:hypothetical protein